MVCQALGIKNMEIIALNKAQLIEILQQTDVTIPPRGPERTNDHIEKWSMAKVLGTLATSGALVYPLRTRKSERPDYRVLQGSKLTGFEITEAINPQYVQAKFLPESKDEGSIVDAGHFKWGETHNLKQLRNISSRTQLTALPWMGNAVELEYARMIKDVVYKKTETLNKAGFSKYPENNLIIFVNQMLPMLEPEEATLLCKKELTGYWGDKSFDNIYVKCDLEIHHYYEDRVKILPLANLWK